MEMHDHAAESIAKSLYHPDHQRETFDIVRDAVQGLIRGDTAHAERTLTSFTPHERELIFETVRRHVS